MASLSAADKLVPGAELEFELEFAEETGMLFWDGGLF